MKSLGVVALALLCLGLFAFAVKNVLTTSREWEMFEQDTARLFTAIEVERLIQDSTDKILARLDSVSEVGMRVANRNRRLGDSLEVVSESLTALLPTLQTPSESLHVTRRALELTRGSLRGLKVSNDSLRGVIRVRDSQNILRVQMVKRSWRLVDSASSVIRRVPKSCRVPLLGLPCPVPTVGLGVTADGIRAYVGVGFPLRQH